VICLPDVQHERRRRYLERSREKGSFPSIDQMPEQRRRVPELTAEIVATFDQQGRWLADNFWDRLHLRDSPCIHSNVRLGRDTTCFSTKALHFPLDCRYFGKAADMSAGPSFYTRLFLFASNDFRTVNSAARRLLDAK
jgi:hypothetical protein